MQAHWTENTASRLLLSGAAMVIVGAGLRATAPVILPCLMAFLLAAISAPLQRRLQRVGVPAAAAVALTMSIVIALIVGVSFLVSGAVNEFAQAAPGYLEELSTRTRVWIDGLREQRVLSTLESAGLPISEWFDADRIDIGGLFDVLGGFVGGTVRGVANTVSDVLIVLIMLVFLLFETAGFGDKLRAAFPGDRAVRQFAQITREMQRYLAVKTFVGALTGIVIGVYLTILDVDFAVLWGVVAFVLNYIPIIGSILAAIPTVLLTILQHGFGYAAIVAIGYIVVNVLVGNLLEPHLMGRRFGLSAFVVCLSLLFWGWLWGPLGMLLSVPLTMVVKIGLEHNPDWRWLAVLMSSSVELASDSPSASPTESEPAGGMEAVAAENAERPPAAAEATPERDPAAPPAA